MLARHTIAVIFLVLGFALGSLINVASATEQAFAEPCPMQDQGDCPCCKGDCTPAVMGCSSHCAVSFGVADLPAAWQPFALVLDRPVTTRVSTYDPFITGPPPPIPIV
ncbi:MAG: hypothetical protein CTY31_14095 [Hyphomicrobium sp.]|nr:MAG: hypothetical protein CTY31_14095 [Hyphomicrobium sp.]